MTRYRAPAFSATETAASASSAGPKSEAGVLIRSRARKTAPANPVAATQSRSRAAAVSRHAVSPALDTATSGTAPALSSIRENAIAQSLNDHRSAIDDESVAGDVGAGARGQEQRSAGNLF